MMKYLFVLLALMLLVGCAQKTEDTADKVDADNQKTVEDAAADSSADVESDSIEADIDDLDSLDDDLNLDDLENLGDDIDAIQID